MRRRAQYANEVERITYRGLDVYVKYRLEPTDVPWDGDEPLEPNAEGWDIMVDVYTERGGETFRASDSLGGNWIYPDREGMEFLEEQIDEVVEQALQNLADEIHDVANGRDVLKAQKRQQAAASWRG